ncbi:hypothetical protein [Novipirellula caenicola]|uniref:PIN domain-containing protein n=1 Tax=Novipirellula caenicola TaxID=1536901 RepID=A0ABP9VSY3_9BACT
MSKDPRVASQMDSRICGTIQMPTVGSVPAGAIPICRLGHVMQKFPFDPQTIANSIRFREGGSVFCDTSLFISETDSRIWDALIEHDRLTIIPPILDELEWWLQDEKVKNEQIRAIVKGQRDGVTDPVNLLFQPPSEIWHTIQYYVSLLGSRKFFAEIVRERFIRENGRSPSNQEVSNILQGVGTTRAQLLAKQGKSSKLAEHKVNDEYLVVSAFVRAIALGEETTILTADEAVLDQCHKASCLMTWHYVSQYLAGVYAEDPSRFEILRIPNPEPEYFVEDELLLLKRKNALPLEVLPSRRTEVQIHCMLLRPDKVTRLTFSAEREMMEVFKIKQTNKGANTDLLNGQNLHLFPPVLARQGNETCAIIATDRSVPEKNSGVYVSPMDLELCLLCDEVHSHVEFGTQPSP